MLVIERKSQEPVYQQIYHQLRAEIETGIRQPGQAVASTRYLAQTLAVSRNTVDHAYQDLVAEGYLVRGIIQMDTPLTKKDRPLVL